MAGELIYIGADNIISPLGQSSEENFEAISTGKSALLWHKDLFQPQEDILCGWISDYEHKSGLTKLESMILQSVTASLSDLNKDISKDNVLMILSTTKGDIEHLKSKETNQAKPHVLLERIKKLVPIDLDIKVISNACISGVLSTIHAHDLIRLGHYDHIIVIGADLVSEFTYRGFKSFHALSDEPCRPFDLNRTGVTLGEGMATVILSKDASLFQKSPLVFAGGTSANDANHISGPSRNGEGLLRAIESCLKQTNKQTKDIDFISAHGTATKFNDNMESIAFNRAGLASVPINSFKGYIGHTLGAAGMLELVLCMASLRNQLLIKSYGYEEPGTTEPLNIIRDNRSQKFSTVLKTASGFGGCNVAAILQSQAS